MHDLIIFNHIPKAGGTSLIKFFEEVYGAEFIFRSRKRDPKTDKYSKAITSLTDAEKSEIKFAAGHFDYGNHKLFEGRDYKYIGVVREPIDILRSDYYYNKEFGRGDLKEQCNRLSLEDYIKSKLANKNSRMVKSCQIEYLTGTSILEEAHEILKNEYMFACTNLQLNDAQSRLASLLGRSDLAPKMLNKSNRNRDVTLSAELSEELKDRFEIDYKFIGLVEELHNNFYWKKQ